MSRHSRFGLAVIASLAVALGCGDDTSQESPAALSAVSSDECASELKWTAGDQGSPLMHPGGDCMGCHQQEPDAPRFAAAGTVYADESAADDCAGVEGATVTLRDAAGGMVALTTNEAGNFYLLESDADFALPLEVTVGFEGQEHTMQTPLYGGNCSSCHSGSNATRAPRRVLIPQAD